MKKGISTLLSLLVIVLLTGCSDKTTKLTGTWQIDKAEVDGTVFTASELKAMGDTSYTNSEIVIKDGGKAYISNDDYGDVIEWAVTDTGVTMGDLDGTIVDGMLCFENGDDKVYFSKISDSQIIGDNQIGDNQIGDDQMSDDQMSDEDLTSGEDQTMDDALMMGEMQEIQEEEMPDAATSSEASVSIQPSPDKYTWYIKNYVGKNCASLGYTSLGGDRLDSYGEGLIKLLFVSPDGAYVDPEDTDVLKKYVVTGQNIAPNTELKYVFATDSEGNEYSNLVSTQSIEEIELTVKSIDQ